MSCGGIVGVNGMGLDMRTGKAVAEILAKEAATRAAEEQTNPLTRLVRLTRLARPRPPLEAYDSDSSSS